VEVAAFILIMTEFAALNFILIDRFQDHRLIQFQNCLAEPHSNVVKLFLLGSHRMPTVVRLNN